MNYQEIYKGLNKKASADQVKELAGMLKKASLQKKSLRIPGVAALRDVAGKAVQSVAKMKPVTATYQFVKKHPVGTVGTIIGAGAGLGGVAAGSAGKAGLKQDLAKANQNIKNLTTENTRLQNRGGWDLISENFSKFWQWLSDYFSGKQNSKQDINTQGKK